MIFHTKVLEIENKDLRPRILCLRGAFYQNVMGDDEMVMLCYADNI